MTKFLLVISFCCCYTVFCSAQTITDSLLKVQADSVTAASYSKTFERSELNQKILNTHPYFSITQKAVYPAYTKKTPAPGKEIYFYTIAAILLLFALFKYGFDKYYTDLTNIFFRRSLKQLQLKKQVVQNPLPSFLFNIFFVLTTGFYAALAIQKIAPHITYPFWKLFIYAAACISLIYLLKYFGLKFIGWVFKVSQLANDYLFLIFLVNKILAMLLLPLIIVIALTDEQGSAIGWTLSWLLIAGFVLYRYRSAIILIRKEKSLSLFHFILYVGAFEILPTIVLYKGIEALLK